MLIFIADDDPHYWVAKSALKFLKNDCVIKGYFMKIFLRLKRIVNCLIDIS